MILALSGVHRLSGVLMIGLGDIAWNDIVLSSFLNFSRVVGQPTLVML